MASTMVTRYAAINNIIMRLSQQADISTVEEHISGAVNTSGKQVTFRSAKELIAKMENTK